MTHVRLQFSPAVTIRRRGDRGDDARRMATTVLTAAAANQPPFLRRYAASAVRAAPPGQPQPASPTKDDQTWVRRSAVQPRMLLQRSRGNRRPRLWKGRWTRCGREQVRNAVHYRARPIGCQDGAQLVPCSRVIGIPTTEEYEAARANPPPPEERRLVLGLSCALLMTIASRASNTMVRDRCSPLCPRC